MSSLESTIGFRAPSIEAAALCGRSVAALGRLLEDERADSGALIDLARSLRQLLVAPRIDDATLVVLARTFDATTLFQARGRIQAFVEALEAAGSVGRHALLRDLRTRCVRLLEASGGNSFPCQRQACELAECRERGLCTQLRASPGQANGMAPGSAHLTVVAISPGKAGAPDA